MQLANSMLHLMSLENLCAHVGGVTLDPWRTTRPLGRGPGGQRAQTHLVLSPICSGLSAWHVFSSQAPMVCRGAWRCWCLGWALRLKGQRAQGIRRSLIGSLCWGPQASLCVSGQLLPPQGRQPAGACWPEVSGLAGCWSDLPHVPRGIRVAVFQGQ